MKQRRAPAPDAADLSPLAREFRRAEDERGFLLCHLPETQTQIRITIAASAAVYLLFSLADFARLGPVDDAWLLLAARLLTALCGAACLLWTWRRPASIEVARAAVCLFELVALLAFLLICAKRPADMQWHTVALVIVVLALYIYLPNRLAYAAAMAAGVTLAFIVVADRYGALHFTDMLTLSILLLLANLFGLFEARRYQCLQRQQYQAQNILRNLTIRDPLTGCFNRRHLQQQLLENEITRSRRYKLCMSVVMCDLDHFKQVNDTYGHSGGDLVLRHFGKLLQDMTRNNIDSVVRFGGEEFLLVLPETDLAGAAVLAERLRLALAASELSDDEGRSIRVSASFGVAAVDFSAGGARLTQDELIASADELLYSAKHGGRNQVRAQQLA